MPVIKKIVWKADGISNPEELNRRLSYFMLRLTREDVGLELPPKTRQIVNLTIKDKFRATLTPGLFKSKAATRKALDLSADGKLTEAIKMTDDDLANGASVIDFCYRRATAERIVNALAPHYPDRVFLIHGGVPQAKRDKIIKEARSLGNPHLIAATIDSCSTGIDLSFANVANFIELTWEPHELAQAEARLHRYGQLRAVLIRYLIARQTGDELVLQQVINKLDAFEKIIGKTGDSMLTELDSAPKGQAALDRLYDAMVARAAEEAALIQKQQQQRGQR